MRSKPPFHLQTSQTFLYQFQVEVKKAIPDEKQQREGKGKSQTIYQTQLTRVPYLI
jgi:hypothetical protein